LKSSPAQPLSPLLHSYRRQAACQNDITQVLALQQRPVETLAATALAIIENILIDMGEVT
jgi:hypothetical protein